MKTNRFWIIVLGGVVAAAACAAALLALGGAPAVQAHIFLDGVLAESLDISALAEPRSITIESGPGFNVVDIERGRVRISRANCPDGYCVRQGWISRGTVPIVCLPHRLVIRLDGGGGGGAFDVDAVVG